MSLAQSHLPSRLSFLNRDLPPRCLNINLFILSFTCYLEARNSPTAERLRPGQSFPGHQPYLPSSALHEASCAQGGGGGGGLAVLEGDGSVCVCVSGCV